MSLNPSSCWEIFRFLFALRTDDAVKSPLILILMSASQSTKSGHSFPREFKITWSIKDWFYSCWDSFATSLYYRVVTGPQPAFIVHPFKTWTRVLGPILHLGYIILCIFLILLHTVSQIKCTSGQNVPTGFWLTRWNSLLWSWALFDWFKCISWWSSLISSLSSL